MDTIKVLVADKYNQAALDILAKHPEFSVDVKPGMSPDELKACIADYQALLVRSATKPNADILASATNLKLIVRGGEGTDNIDKKFAAEHGIVVENTPGQNGHAVAELTLGMMFALSRYICRADASTKAGKWEKKKLQGNELRGKTLGIVGAGKIGRDLGKMAVALGMKVICYDVVVGDLDFPRVDLDELLATADYVSLHVPLCDATRNMICSDKLLKMKKSAYLLNVARGDLVDEKALADAINNGVIAGAGVDVFTTEPVAADNPLLSCENVVLTPHLGASSDEAQINCAVAAAEQVVAFFKDGKVLNKVN